MRDEDLVRVAMEFRQGMLGDHPSAMACAMVSWPLAGLLHSLYSLDCECVESDLGHCNHVWIRLADGRALDPTADQFNHFSDCDFPPVYLGQPAIIHQDGKSLCEPLFRRKRCAHGAHGLS